MIELRKQPGQRILELGGGDNPHPLADCNVDVRPGTRTHFVADFNEPLPIQDNEWDAVFSQFVIEHLSWRKVKQFIGEVLRILKPGGKAVIVTANTEAQLRFIQGHPDGWGNQAPFESYSQVLFGDQDYEENTHRNYMSPAVASGLFTAVGFELFSTRPYGDAGTDLLIEAVKPRPVRTLVQGLDSAELHTEERRVLFGDPAVPAPQGTMTATLNGFPVVKTTEELPEAYQQPYVLGDFPAEEMQLSIPIPREELFDRHYFNGGGKVGGYAREGYWDYPVHWHTFNHLMTRRPESVLEVGCARGYLVKKLQDAGIPAHGLEISKHCYLTRAADNVHSWDICNTAKDWPVPMAANGPGLDLCFSIATLEHIPEEFLPHVIRQMQLTCKRGLHGIDFGEHDDGFDKTHCSLFPKAKWEQLFAQYAPGWPVEIVDKESLEQGMVPQEVLFGDGKVKLEIGSYTIMSAFGWINVDQHDLAGFAQQHNYRYLKHDVTTGLPFNTGTVDLIHANHFLEHLSYKQGLTFLRECRRVLRPTGTMRFAVPDAEFLCKGYAKSLPFWDLGDVSDSAAPTLRDFDEISDGAAACPTVAGKLWELLFSGHQAAYDWETLKRIFEEAGFTAFRSAFRTASTDRPGTRQILRETLDTFPCLSCYVDAFPQLGN